MSLGMLTVMEQGRVPTFAKNRSASEAVTAEESSLLSRHSLANLAPSISSVCCNRSVTLGLQLLLEGGCNKPKRHCLYHHWHVIRC